MGYDEAGRISALTDSTNIANSRSYAYDNLDRLTTAVLPATTYTYGYDAVGNRTQQSGVAINIAAASNRIDNIASAPPRTFNYDNTGNTTADGINAYTYDARGRLKQTVSSLGATSYQVDARGRRSRKTLPGGQSVIFHYDLQGRLIAESLPTGQIKKEYFYLYDEPVAVSVTP